MLVKHVLEVFKSGLTAQQAKDVLTDLEVACRNRLACRRRENVALTIEARHCLRLSVRCPLIFASDEFICEGTVVDLGVPSCAVESRGTPSPRDYVRLHVLMRGDQGTLGLDW
jgi:hypothetical protein